jgi:hypothetical protein
MQLKLEGRSYAQVWLIRNMLFLLLENRNWKALLC